MDWSVNALCHTSTAGQCPSVEAVEGIGFPCREGYVEVRDGGELRVLAHADVVTRHFSEAGQPRDVSECCVVVDAEVSPNTGQRGETTKGGECCIVVDVEPSPNTGQRGESIYVGEGWVVVDVEESPNTGQG